MPATKINVVELRSQLAKLKEKETVAHTRKEMLAEEKQKLLSDIHQLLDEVDKLKLIPKSELTPQNLQLVLDKLLQLIQSEVAECQLPNGQ